MKTNSVDTRRVHARITIRDGQRHEEVVWGDVRRVTIVLDPEEVPDMRTNNRHDGRGTVMFRPETAHIEWQRNTYFGHNVGGTAQWQSTALKAEGWTLTNAGVRGTNVKKDGTTGKLQESALYANMDGWGVSSPPEQPGWYAALLAAHDPNITGSALDAERVVAGSVVPVG